MYSTFDWGFVTLTATTSSWAALDDVINVAGHRLGTREIEESISIPPQHRRGGGGGRGRPAQGQVAMAFAVAKRRLGARFDDAARLQLEGEVMKQVDATSWAPWRDRRACIL